MLSSLYAYKGTHARTLKFIAGEKFLEIGISKDVNWVHVISEKGALGYVPKNYVSLEQIPPIQMLEIIDSCLEAIHLIASERGGNYSRDEHEALQRLVEMRQEWHSKVPPQSHPGKRPAPPPPHRSSSHFPDSNIANGTVETSNSQPSPPILPPSSSLMSLSRTVREDSGIEVSTSFIGRGNSLAPDEEETSIVPPVRVESLGKNRIPTPMENSSVECIKNAVQLLPKGYYRQMVDKIRSDTNISFSTSHQVVTLVLQSLGSTFPFMEPLLDAILEEEGSALHQKRKKGELVMYKESVDGTKLVEILESLRECKDDEQQRSWALHEDEITIRDILNNLLDVLNNGDLHVCNDVLALDDHRGLLTLVQYYQMETRWVLRKILLQIFGSVCQMSKYNVSFLSSSVLPLELSRQLLDPETSLEQLKYCSLVLGMVLSMADTLPVTHFSIMNEYFIEMVLDGIERYNEIPDTESLAELYLTLLLSFNLQFHITSFEDGRLNLENNKNENSVIKLLGRRKENKYLLEKVLLLFNREDDPVSIFEHDPRPPNSVMCFMKDLYSSAKTAQLLYTNDEMVVCDIILRQLTDLSADDKPRQEYLSLLEGLITFGHWKEHRHRWEELYSRLVLISREDCPKDCPEDAAVIANRIISSYSS